MQATQTALTILASYLSPYADQGRNEQTLAWDKTGEAEGHGQ